MVQPTISMGEAAKLAGVSKSTLTRAVKAGRLSAERNEAGAYRVQVAELERVYPMQAHRSAPRTMMHHAPEPVAPGAAAFEARIEGLEAQLALVREQLDEVRQQRDDAKEQRNGWQRQAEAAQRLVADMRPPRRSWFGWRAKA